MSYISQTLILKNKIHCSFLFLTLVVDFAHQMGNDIFIVMQTMVTITEDTVYPLFPLTTIPNSFRDLVE